MPRRASSDSAISTAPPRRASRRGREKSPRPRTSRIGRGHFENISVSGCFPLFENISGNHISSRPIPSKIDEIHRETHVEEASSHSRGATRSVHHTMNTGLRQDPRQPRQLRRRPQDLQGDRLRRPGRVRGPGRRPSTRLANFDGASSTRVGRQPAASPSSEFEQQFCH